MTAYSSIKDVTPGVSDGKVAGIEFAAVNMTFADGTTALKSLDLTIEEGEFVVFVGPSGCGKSTALRILAGLEQATGGTVAIKGRDVTDLGPQQRDIAMVFQSYALYPHKSVYENLAYPLRIRGLDKGTIETAVAGVADLLGLTALLKRKPGALSGGQRQRVAMGRALVRNPEAFLMDEPLSNLDAALRVEMRGEIKRLHRRLGVTTVYVTHDQVEAMTMGDRVAVLRGGELQQFDAPQRLYEQPANMFVASFIGSPAMSLVPLEASSVNGNTVLTSSEGWTLPLSPLNTRKVQGAKGKKIVLGARHSTIKLHKTAVEGAIPSRVYTVEPTGDITFVQSFMSGAIVNISVPPSVAVAPDEQVWLEVDQERMHLFDGETEMALRAD